MKTKTIIFITGLFLLQFMISCFCKNSQFVDFTEMTIFSKADTLSTNDSLVLELKPTDPTFMASNSNQLGFSNSYATSCEYGWKGMKFPITKVEITSDNDFSLDHSSGASLNDLFKSDLDSLNSLEEDISEDLKSIGYGVVPEIILTTSPSLSQEHTFTITFTKSNGEEIVAVSDKIIWN